MEWIADPQALIALVTLTVLEIVLGIDNIIFISILAGKLPHEQQGRARQVGLALAMITRILLLLSLTWIARLTEPLFAVFHFEISGRALILLGGGLFLLAKSTYEIHERLEGETAHASAKVQASFTSVITQIILLDIVFSLDSVITAVGMANQLWVMITRDHRRIDYVVGFQPHQRLCQPPSYRQDAGLELPVADWLFAHGGGVGTAYSESLHLLCDGFLRFCGNAESATAG